MRTDIFPFAPLALLAGLTMLAATTPALANDVETLPCNTTTDWVLSDFRGAGGKPANAAMGIYEDSVTMRYQRNVLGGLVHMKMLTELVELRLRVQSSRDIQILVALSDLDGARWHHLQEIKGGEWVDVTISPRTIKLADDSPVKKNRCDPERLGIGYGIIDTGVLTGASGENYLRVDQVEIETKDLERTSGELVIDKSVTISKSREHHGNIVIEKGGSLKVTAPRAQFRGNITVVDGSVEFTGGVVAVPQAFNHQNRLTFTGSRAKWKLRDCTLITLKPLKVELREKASMMAASVACTGGLTVDIAADCEVKLDSVAKSGEYIVAPGGSIDLTGCNETMVWLVLGPNLDNGELEVPTDTTVNNWKCDIGLDVKVKDCTAMHWGILSAGRGSGTVANSMLRAAGVVCGGSSAFELKGLKNKQPLRDWPLTLWDRTLRFTESRVDAWNCYTTHSARLTLDESQVGEVLTFDESSMEVRNSIIDGTGGYVGANHKSTLRLVGCQIHCLVVARDHATIILDRCVINGPVRATGNGTVELHGCDFKDRVENDPGARLVIVPKK